MKGQRNLWFQAKAQVNLIHIGWRRKGEGGFLDTICNFVPVNEIGRSLNDYRSIRSGPAPSDADNSVITNADVGDPEAEIATRPTESRQRTASIANTGDVLKAKNSSEHKWVVDESDPGFCCIVWAQAAYRECILSWIE